MGVHQEMYVILMTDQQSHMERSIGERQPPEQHQFHDSGTARFGMYVDMMVAGSAAAESVVAGSASSMESGGAAHCPGSPLVIMSGYPQSKCHCDQRASTQEIIAVRYSTICMLQFVADSEPEVSRRPSSTHNPDLDEVLDILKS